MSILYLLLLVYLKKNRLVIYCSKTLLERTLIVYINFFSNRFYTTEFNLI